MKVCPSCGERLSDDAKFCPVDGTALKPASEAGEGTPAGQFAKTLYFSGAPVAGDGGAAPDPSAAYDDLPASTSVDFVAAGRGVEVDVDVNITPAAVPVVEEGSGPDAKDLPTTTSLVFPRPKPRMGLVLLAALGGAAVVGLIALGVTVLRRPSSEASTPVVASIEQKEPAVAPATPPTPPPAAPAPTGLPSDAQVARADASAEPTPPAQEAPQPEPAIDAGKPKPQRSAQRANRTKTSAKRSTGKSDPPSTTKPAASNRPASSADPKQAEIYVRAGEKHLKRGSYSKAQAAFEQARAYDPSSAAALAGLGEVAFEQGKYAEATENLRAAVRIERNSRYLTLLGNSYFKRGKYRQAIEQYKRALKLAPGNQEASDGLKAAQTKLHGG